jgi:hypothetical protein
MGTENWVVRADDDRLRYFRALAKGEA